ncbi:AAA domain-containing protein [Methylomagnum ishizawai]|uniref:AAA domain-containing protein n=1 Tax=Methylomagnum ishizawai TaxID=1760988 RepID=A0A1Y6CU57_9GAMM|nr:AAA family ATPase [Methylomagnum ishizawai]SMF94158.1 AAA domain-containing protein [Methylomagnum ishizawai]
MAALEEVQADGPLAGSLLSEARERKFDLLLHLAVNLSQPIVVSGPEGMGKTVFLRRLESSARAYASVCYLAATAGTTYEFIIEELRRAALRDLNLANAGGWTCAEVLARYGKERRLLVLMLDNAHRLLPGLLSGLWEFAREHPSLHIVLALPSHSLRRKATTDALALRDAQPLEIPALGPSEFSAYLRQMAAAQPELAPGSAAAESQVIAWHARAQGAPGAVLGGLAPPAEAAPSPLWRGRWWVPGLAATLLVAAALLWWKPEGQPPESPPGFPSPKADADSALPGMMLHEPSAPAVVEGGHPANPGESQPQADGSATLPEVPPQPQAGAVTQAPEPQTPSVQPEPAQAPPPIPESQAQPEPSAVATARPPESPAATPPPEPLSPEQQARLQAAAVSLEGVQGVDWIMAQNPEAYTLQILAMSQAGALAGTIGRFPPESALSVLRSRKGRGDLYLLFHGVYPNMAAAREGAAGLPPPLTQAIPRQFKSIQADLLRPPGSGATAPAQRWRVPHKAQQP